MKRLILAIALCGCATLLWLLCSGAAAAQETSAAYTTKARAAFLAVDRAAQLDSAAQAAEIPHLYRDVWSVLQRDLLSQIGWFPPKAGTPAGPPEQRADALERQGGGLSRRGELFARWQPSGFRLGWGETRQLGHLRKADRHGRAAASADTG